LAVNAFAPGFKPSTKIDRLTEPFDSAVTDCRDTIRPTSGACEVAPLTSKDIWAPAPAAIIRVDGMTKARPDGPMFAVTTGPTVVKFPKTRNNEQ
jgi:hypothetical protein